MRVWLINLADNFCLAIFSHVSPSVLEKLRTSEKGKWEEEVGREVARVSGKGKWDG
jgi:hypothetical protein